MDPVKSIKLQETQEKVVDMNKVKKDVIGVKFTLPGKDYGVHAVVTC